MYISEKRLENANFIRNSWVSIGGKIEGGDTFYASNMQMGMSCKGGLRTGKRRENRV